jgi:WD40 repeat protein
MKKRLSLIMVTLFFSAGLVYPQNPQDFLWYKTDSKNIYDICLSYGGQVLGVADNEAIKVFSVRTGELLAEFKDGHKNRIQAIDISKDSTLLVSGGRDSTLVIWDFQTQRILKTLDFHAGIITSVKISPCNRYLIAGGTGRMLLYDIKENIIIAESAGYFTAVAFSPDAQIFACAGVGKRVYFYETQSGIMLAKLKAHKSWVRSISFSNDGTRLISCGDDSKVRIWDISDLEHIELLRRSRRGFGWLLHAGLHDDNETWAYGSFKGKAGIIHRFGNYSVNLKVPVTRILFVNQKESSLQVVAATRGKGAVRMNAENMKAKMK